MDKQTLSPNTNHHHHHHHHHQDSHPSLLPPSSTGAATIKEDSPRKPPHGGGSGGNDRLKRDEWSEGAVSCLLEAYESKWILRNRAKLKGQDWDDVARHVSARANNTKSPKTQTQCKNKIESMKKRYRSESAAAGADGHGSSWVLYPRLDLLLRGNSVVSTQQQPAAAAAAAAAVSHHQLPNQQLQQAGNSTSNSALVLLETSTAPPAAPPPPPPPPPVMAGTAQNSNGSNGFDHRGMPKEDGVGTKLSDHVSDKKAIIDTDSSTPALYSQKHDKLRSKSTTFMKMKNIDQKRKSRRKGREEYWEIAESIRWMAEVVVRSEQARMDTMREIEKMRVEAEAKRGELDLKRTEIIANTQLEIAKLFAASGGGGGGGGSGNGKNVDHSLRIGRN